MQSDKLFYFAFCRLAFSTEESRSITIYPTDKGFFIFFSISELLGSKVDGVAVVSAIFAAEKPGEATKDLLAKTKKLVEENE